MGRRLFIAVTVAAFVGVGLIVGTTLYLADLKGQIHEQHTTITNNQRTQCPEVNPDPRRCRALLKRLLRYGTTAERRAVQQAAASQGRVLPAVTPTSGPTSPLTSRQGPLARTPVGSSPRRPPSGGGSPSSPAPSAPPAPLPTPAPSPAPAPVQQLLNDVTDLVRQGACPLLRC